MTGFSAASPVTKAISKKSFLSLSFEQNHTHTHTCNDTCELKCGYEWGLALSYCLYHLHALAPMQTRVRYLQMRLETRCRDKQKTIERYGCSDGSIFASLRKGSPAQSLISLLLHSLAGVYSSPSPCF